MAQVLGWRIVLGLAAAGILSACVETAGTSGDTGATAGATGTRVRAGAEVEAPEVFSASESALWDGRPSLGGIWVASPDAIDPERVVMFNPATGKSVKGALFRRERDNPGPRLQLSSDAAEALGVLAGMPTEIQVTALRKQEVVEEVPAEAPAEVPVDPGTAEDAPAAGQDGGATQEAGAATDAAAVAAAALDAVDAGTDAGTDAAGAAAGADPAAGDPAAEGAVAEPPKKKTWKEKRAEAKAAREAKKAAAAAAEAAAAGVAVGEDGAAPTAETAGVAEIESAPLDARKPEVAAEDATTPEAAEPAGNEAAPAAAADPAPAATGGATRTIQIASFSKEDNANRAVEALSKIGIAARSQKLEKDGKAVWGVVATGDAAMLQKIKDAGFADAYFLK